MNGTWFGIPQVGMIDVDGDYLENKQLEPDHKVAQDPAVVSEGRDQQLEKAVEEVIEAVPDLGALTANCIATHIPFLLCIMYRCYKTNPYYAYVLCF